MFHVYRVLRECPKLAGPPSAPRLFRAEQSPCGVQSKGAVERQSEKARRATRPKVNTTSADRGSPSDPSASLWASVPGLRADSTPSKHWGCLPATVYLGDSDSPQLESTVSSRCRLGGGAAGGALSDPLWGVLFSCPLRQDMR